VKNLPFDISLRQFFLPYISEYLSNISRLQNGSTLLWTQCVCIHFFTLPPHNKDSSIMIELLSAVEKIYGGKLSPSKEVLALYSYLSESVYYMCVFFTNCITPSGSNFHQLLAALKKRRKLPNLPKGLEPPANQVSNKGAPLLKGARPS
jgi:hypothetical protein